MALAALAVAGAAAAHESYLDCFDNRDGTVTCQAGYEDGSPPSDEDRILVKDADGNTLISGGFDDGKFSFKRPGGDDFMVIFVGGEIGHSRRISGRELIGK
jgi:hypothetical protein